jgi:CRISPR-associated protein Csm3
MDRKLLGKVIISGKLECLTGLHIGASKENIEIGAIDSPVVRDPITREPYIPGSSLKGKMRALLEKAFGISSRRNIGTIGNPVEVHVCNDAPDAINCPICRIFGSTGKDGGKNFPARLIVRDLKLTDESREKLANIDTGLQYTEWKFENAIDRITSAANPRQLERVPRGAEFLFELVYNVEDLDQIKIDLNNVELAIKLIEADAIGGHGSRGYGHVKFKIEKIEGKTIDGFKGDTTKSKQITSFTQLNALEEFFKSNVARPS